MDNLKQFLVIDENTISANTFYSDNLTLPLFQNALSSITYIGEITIGYVIGYLALSIIKVVKQSKIYIDKLIYTERTNPLIASRAYTLKYLTGPFELFLNLVKVMFNILTKMKPKLCNQKLIG